MGSRIGLILSMTLMVAAAPEAPAEPARPANPAAAKALLEQVAAGTKAWSRSCRRGQAPQPCASARALPATHRCGTGPFNTWVPNKRRAGPTKRAIEHMKRAQALWDELSEADRTSEVRAAYGAALFVLVDKHFDDVLATTPPRGLRFDPDKPEQTKRDQQRFMKWLQSTQSHLTELRGRARDIVERAPNSEWAAAASGRTGTALEFFAGQLERMEVPVTLRKGPYAAETQVAFCDALTEQAQPMREQSKRALEMCVEIAQRVPSASAWLAQCQRQP